MILVMVNCMIFSYDDCDYYDDDDNDDGCDDYDYVEGPLYVWYFVLRNVHLILVIMNVFGIVLVIMIKTRERGVECQLYFCWVSFPPQPKILCKKVILIHGHVF